MHGFPVRCAHFHCTIPMCTVIYSQLHQNVHCDTFTATPKCALWYIHSLTNLKIYVDHLCHNLSFSGQSLICCLEVHNSLQISQAISLSAKMRCLPFEGPWYLDLLKHRYHLLFYIFAEWTVYQSISTNQSITDSHPIRIGPCWKKVASNKSKQINRLFFQCRSILYLLTMSFDLIAAKLS